MAVENEVQSETLVSTNVDANMINDCYESGMDSQRESVQAFIQCGEYLSVKKKELDRGFNRWCKDNLVFSKAKAYQMIAVYEWTEKCHTCDTLEWSQFRELTSLEPSEFESFCEYIGADISEFSARKIHKLIKRYQGKDKEEFPEKCHTCDTLEWSTENPASRIEEVDNTLTSRISELESECSKLNDRIKGLIIIKDNKNKKIEQLRAENEALRDNLNQVRNERNDSDVYESSSFYRNYVDYNMNKYNSFDDYVDNLIKNRIQKAIKEYKEEEAYDAS